MSHGTEPQTVAAPVPASHAALVAQLLAEGWRPGCPSKATELADRHAYGLMGCPGCGHAHVAFEPFVRGHEYMAVLRCCRRGCSFCELI